MEFPEQVIREMIGTSHWQHCYQYFGDLVDQGERVVINMADGSALAMRDRASVAKVLRENFGWVDEIPDVVR